MRAAYEIELKKWFPGLYRKGGTKCAGKPKLRILCFPPAGCAEDLFSSEGTGARATKSPLIEWAKVNEAEILAVQHPGRINRKKEEFAPSIQDIARPLHSVLCDYCNDGVPYVIVAHSVGTWIAYELLVLLGDQSATPSKRTMAMPEHVFFSSFPPPTIPMEDRPWNVNKDLTEEEFKTECRRWDINEIVFTIWSVYHPLLRADFTLFDQYTYNHHDDKPKFAWPVTVFSAANDNMITEAMCRGWKEETSGVFDFVPVDGHHLFPLEKEAKATWLITVSKGLDGVMEMIELKLEYEGMGL